MNIKCCNNLILSVSVYAQNGCDTIILILINIKIKEIRNGNFIVKKYEVNKKTVYK